MNARGYELSQPQYLRYWTGLITFPLRKTAEFAAPWVRHASALTKRKPVQRADAEEIKRQASDIDIGRAA